MNEQKFKEEAKKYRDIISEEAAELWQLMRKEPVTIGEVDDDYQYFFRDNDGYFDPITWINNECLEWNKQDCLLATGGPAYGVVMIRNHPYFWYQDWFTTKDVTALEDDAAEFYIHLFEYMDEMV